MLSRIAEVELGGPAFRSMRPGTDPWPSITFSPTDRFWRGLTS
jgi:hypothetical protein